MCVYLYIGLRTFMLIINLTMSVKLINFTTTEIILMYNFSNLIYFTMSKTNK